MSLEPPTEDAPARHVAGDRDAVPGTPEVAGGPGPEPVPRTAGDDGRADDQVEATSDTPTLGHLALAHRPSAIAELDLDDRPAAFADLDAAIVAELASIEEL